MTEEIMAEAAPEVLTDLGEGPTTPLQHKNPTAEPDPEPVAPKTVAESVKEAMAKVEADENKAAAKDDPKENTESEAKADEEEEVAAPKKEAGKAGESEAEKASQSEGKRINAPSRLLPSERDVWVNTPRAVQGAFERLEREYEAKLGETKAAADFHAELREFDDLAKKSGTTIKEALANFVNAENAIRQDFGRGITQLAQSMGKNPTQAVAEFMRAANVTPQQLGAYLQGQPAQAPQQQQQRPVDPTAQAALQRVQQLEQQLAKQAEEAQRMAELQRVEQEIIGPAKVEMPRFDELHDKIVKLLETGYIDTSLSPDVRLREAYHAADRLYPALYEASSNEIDLDDKRPSPGNKSIKGAPGKSSTSSGKPKIMSIRESIAAAMRTA